MKKILTSAVLLLGLSVAFANNTKHLDGEHSVQRTEEINSVTKDCIEKNTITKIIKENYKIILITWIQLEFFYVVGDEIHYYNILVPLP